MAKTANKLTGSENECQITVKGGKIVVATRANGIWSAPGATPSRNLRDVRAQLKGDPQFTYVLFDNGREVENTDADTFATETAAREAGHAALDDLCPRLSPLRSAYRVTVRRVD